MHLLEVARSLRFQSGFSLEFWGACVMANVHIINRLPTLVLHNGTPYETLYNCPATFDQFKIFGCLAFATNSKFSSDKFAHRGVPCVFMGYQLFTKGYILYNLLTKK